MTWSVPSMSIQFAWSPPGIVEEIAERMATTHGYTASRGLLESRQAVADHYAASGIAHHGPDRIWLGNGVSELIAMSLQGLLADGDEVLVPSPDYPLWTAMITLCGGRAVHYRCDPDNGWQPDVEDARAKVTARTKAIVVINPNNPTGAVYGREVLLGITDIARQHELLVLSDEIYDQVLYDGRKHLPTAAVAPDLLCLTFGGLSKGYLVAGYRAGWVIASGPDEHARDYLDGLTVLANLRLCPNTAGQIAVEAALRRPADAVPLTLPGQRLAEQRDIAWRLLTAIPGVTCSRPAGAMYAFPRLDPAVYGVQDDEDLALRLLRQQGVMVVPGRGFNWPRPDHLRIVTLPPADVLSEAIARLAAFLAQERDCARPAA